MNDRITEFVRGLRAAGVRVSLSEGLDAFRAVQFMGIQDRTLFRESLRTTLIKEAGWTIADASTQRRDAIVSVRLCL